MTTPSGPGQRSARSILTGGEGLRHVVETARGGDDKFHPRTYTAAAELLLPQMETLKADIAALSPRMKGPRIIVRAETAPNYLAASDFPGSLFDEIDAIPVGTLQTKGDYRTARLFEPDQPSRTYYLAVREESIDALLGILRAGAPSRKSTIWSDLRKFNEVRLAHAEETVAGEQEEETGELLTWEAVLHPMTGRSIAGGEVAEQEIIQKLTEAVAANSGEIALEHRRQAGGLSYIPILLTRSGARRLADFNPLRSIRRMARLRPIVDGGLRSRTSGASAPKALPPAGLGTVSQITVACFDGGVDTTCPCIGPFVRQVDRSGEPIDPEALLHGSMVTNAMLYGYHASSSQLPQPIGRVDHFRVWPVPATERFDLDLYWVLGVVEEEVRRKHYPVVVLCVAPREVIDDTGAPHIWTSTLDALAQELGVVFVVAAGNDGDADQAQGLHRIQVPADMVNGIAVGACDSRDATKVLVRAKYSSYGPGRQGSLIQPIGLAFGGEEGGEAFTGIGPQGALVEDVGTSFAAPLAAHGLAKLAATLGSGRGTPSMLRGAAAHFAGRRRTLHSAAEHGYGRLREQYASDLECQENSVTVLYQDVLKRNEVVALPLPFPPSLDPTYPLSILCTLSYMSTVDAADPVDYTNQGLGVVFRPHAKRYHFTPPRGSGLKGVDLDETLQEAQIKALLLQGYKKSLRPATDNVKQLKTEQARREHGKWETLTQVRRQRILVEQLHEPEIEVAYYARSGGHLVSGQEAHPLAYSMIVTLTAPKGVELYEAAKNHFKVLVPLVMPLRIMT